MIADIIINGLAEELKLKCDKSNFNSYIWEWNNNGQKCLVTSNNNGNILIRVTAKKGYMTSRWVEFDINDPELIDNISKIIK